MREEIKARGSGSDSEDYRAATLRTINEEIVSGRLQNDGSQHLTNRLVE